MAVANPFLARVVLEYLKDTRIMQNVFHIKRLDTGEITHDDLIGAGIAVNAWWNAIGKTLCSSLYTLYRSISTKLDDTSPLQDIAIVNTPGTSSANPVPADATLSVGLRAGLAGRKYRGRMFQVGIARENTTVLDQVTSAALAAYVSSVANLNGQLFSNGLQQVIYHRNDGSYNIVGSWTADANLDSQRNRLPTRGI